MMRRVHLQTAEARAAFAAKFADRTANPLSAALLAQTDAIGFVDDDGALVGGFLINDRAPYRYVEMIPASHRRAPHVRRYLEEGRASEIVCMWLDRSRMTIARRARIYVSAVATAVRKRRRFVVAGTVTERVAATHKLVFRRMIYCGPTTFDGAPYGEIYAARPIEVLLLSPFAILIEIARRWPPARRRVLRGAAPSFWKSAGGAPGEEPDAQDAPPGAP